MKINSISHNGYGEMWYPFSFENQSRFALIRTESCDEIYSFIHLLEMMFAVVNQKSVYFNHLPRKKIDTRKGTQCTIKFETNKHKYCLERYIISNFSIETRLTKEETGIVYNNDDAISILKKIIRPKIITNETSYYQKSSIYKAASYNEMKNMEKLANSISTSVGIKAKLRLNYEGRWSVFGDELVEEFNSKTMIFPSFLQLITNLSQAIMKRRVHGYCEPILTCLESVILNRLETSTLLYQAESIANTEQIDLLICFDCDKTESLVDAIETPRLKCYEY